MHTLFGITLVLYLLKLSVGQGFFKKSRDILGAYLGFLQNYGWQRWTAENRECFINYIVYRIEFNVF